MSGTIFPPPPPCRICGEADLVSFMPEFAAAIAHRADGSVAKARSGKALTVWLDCISCDVCMTTMTVDVWNGKLPSEAERKAYRAHIASLDKAG